MLQILTFLAILAACGLAISSRASLGWMLIGATDLVLIGMLWSAKKRYRFRYVDDLSPQANEMLKRYGHYFVSPFASRELSSSAATTQFGAIILAVINCFTGYWGGILLAILNWIIMGPVAVAASPAALVNSSDEARLAHEEVVSFVTPLD